MTAFRVIVDDLPGVFLRSYFVILIIAQVSLCVTAFLRKRSAVYRILNLAHLTVSFIIFTLVIDGTFRAEYLGKPRDFPAAVDFVYSLPVWIFWVAAALETAALILLFIDAKRRHDREISYDSVKEALDLLPEGLGYYQTNGAPVMVNARMTEVAYELTGDSLINAERLWSTAEEFSKSEAEPLLLPLDSGSTYLLSRGESARSEQTFVNISGEDISEQYRITLDLQSKNLRLAHIRRRYIEYSRDVIKYERERSVFSARADVHSELGHALLIAKAFLSGENSDGKALLSDLRETNTVMMNNRREALPDPSPCATASRKAASIGVKVDIIGAAPEGSNAEIILARAIDECSSNAAKHSSATQLTVTVETGADGYAIKLIHNGKSPDGEYTESGGLMLLRYETQSFGGTLTVVPLPVFSVVITLPANDAPEPQINE